MNFMNLIKVIISLIIGFSTLLSLSAQDDSILSESSEIKDSVCYKYDFRKGDTLRYYIVSHDSIVIDYARPLLKRRFELIEITCDSVTKDGHFIMSQCLLQYLRTESQNGVEQQLEESSPWIGRKVWYETDSLGKRYTYRHDDSTKGAICPGGAFQPYLLFDIGESCKAIDESWIVESLDDIPENGIPVPLLRQTSLFRSRENLDTLEESCNQLEFIKTGQGSIRLNEAGGNIRITNIINGYGKLLISIDNQIPIHFLSTLEQKLTIEMENGSKKPGWHYIHTAYTLDSYKPGPEIRSIDLNK
jgi:hypothetical protein